MKFTRAATVATLSLPPGKHEAIFFDDEVPGFGVRLRAAGSRTWIVQYRIGSKNRRITLGSTSCSIRSKPVSVHATSSPAFASA